MKLKQALILAFEKQHIRKNESLFREYEFGYGGGYPKLITKKIVKP